MELFSHLTQVPCRNDFHPIRLNISVKSSFFSFFAWVVQQSFDSDCLIA